MHGKKIPVATTGGRNVAAQENILLQQQNFPLATTGGSHVAAT